MMTIRWVHIFISCIEAHSRWLSGCSINRHEVEVVPINLYWTHIWLVAAFLISFFVLSLVSSYLIGKLLNLWFSWINLLLLLLFLLSYCFTSLNPFSDLIDLPFQFSFFFNWYDRHLLFHLIVINFFIYCLLLYRFQCCLNIW
jgi:hypothetical protein